MEGFSAGQVVKVTGVLYDSVDHWVKQGIVDASLTTGRNKRFAFTDVIAVKVVANLRSSGVSLQAIKKVTSRLREAHGLSLAGCRLLVAGDDVLLAKSEEELVSMLRRPGQQVMMLVLDLGQVETEVREAVAQLAA